MVLKMISSDSSYYISEKIKKGMLKAKKQVYESDQDRVFVITGREGLGKTTLAFQLAYLVDPTFNLNDVVYNSDALAKAIQTHEPRKAIVMDEAFNGLSSKGALSKENKKLVRLLMECRQRNFFIFIVLPSFFLLEKYVAIFRSHALFNVLASRKNFKLRYYKVYNYHNKKRLYILGHKMLDYSKPYIPTSHRFYRKLPPSIDEKAYRKKKLSAFQDRPKQVIGEDRFMTQRDCLIRYLYLEVDLSQQTISKIIADCGFPIDQSNISRMLRKDPQIA